MIVPFFQYCGFSQLQATRAISGRSVPIIVCGAAGAGFFIRYFGPESMGGTGDVGAKIDAEVARTGLSDDEIGPKVLISLITMLLLYELSDLIFYKDIPPYRRETRSDSWPSCNV